MSVAFTKEEDTENAAAVDLPDRPISPHPNLVTQEGLAQLEAALVRARSDYAAHQATESGPGDPRALARAARDLRYFAARLATAHLTPCADAELVRFGALVSVERDDGRRQRFRIVGEDEADPGSGTISYVSPLARALLGKACGEVALINGSEVEITAIEV